MKKTLMPGKPTRSLRNSLIFWILTFSIVPLIFVTGFSLRKSELAIDRELHRRLSGNAREIAVTLSEMESLLLSRGHKLASERPLVYYLSGMRRSEAKNFASERLGNSVATRLSLIGPGGQMLVSVFKDQNGEVQVDKALENKEFLISEELLEKLKLASTTKLVDFKKESIDLIIYHKVVSWRGKDVGFIEQVVSVGRSFLESLKKRLGAELVLLNKDFGVVTASHDDLALYEEKYFEFMRDEPEDVVHKIDIRSAPHLFSVFPVKWGKDNILMGLAASKSEANETFRNIKAAFAGVLVTVIILVILLTLLTSNAVVRPLKDLYEGIVKMERGEEDLEVPVRSDTELGYLSASFNNMAQNIKQTKDELRQNIKDLETTNEELKNTQAQLVQAAKMASLGQLVAGVAHELNNPIGFIYSNMGHLKDYSEKLVDMVEAGSESPQKVKKLKEELEFDYIRDDLPKLIHSCEEGARRTRDIVMGLKKFSRLDEAVSKEANVHDGIEDTIGLLQGEIKAKDIEIDKKFGKLPEIPCFPSQLNQVFMNILSNAVQAVSQKGKIVITTGKNEKEIYVSFKDNGKGMSKEIKDKIFDPFFTTKSVGEGTGLGMSISYGIIEKHNGTLDVFSEPQKGTEFIIRLPLS